ncbi:unnamed protein product [Phytophthora fragariaefolia]|uniref:Unnamed protein product n=1 Tax=Phytophthora fragariaefolia TaxID=1490495 RepID=A0A9W6XRR8_9STRA|nr:unnamed protein product [Phytophthora fragariaefolia]
MGIAEADVPPWIRIPQQEDSAAASVTVNTNESGTDELPGTIVPRRAVSVQWLDTQYQNKDERLNLRMIPRGNANYRSLPGNSSRVGWGHLCTAGTGADTQVEGDIDDMDEYSDGTDRCKMTWTLYTPMTQPQTTDCLFTE